MDVVVTRTRENFKHANATLGSPGSVPECHSMPPALSLKQRLAALSIAPSSPSSPDVMVPGSPRRRKFSLHWSKRGGAGGDEASAELDRVQDVLGKMIFQAGVDFE